MIQSYVYGAAKSNIHITVNFEKIPITNVELHHDYDYYSIVVLNWCDSVTEPSEIINADAL